MTSQFIGNSLKQLGLFALLGAALLTSCKRPDDATGFGLIPGEDLLYANQTDDFIIALQNQKNDSVFMDERSRVMLGSISDPIFGESAASFYTQFSLSTASPDFPDNYAIDSVIMTLSYYGYAFGNRNPFYPSVHELTEDIYIDSSYLKSEGVAYRDQNIVNTDDPRLWAGIKMDPYNNVIYAGDTLGPNLRIPLQKSIGEKIIGAPSDSLSSDANFTKYFKGLYVYAFGTNVGICDFDLLNTNTKIRIYYRDLSTDPAETDYYDLVVTSEDARFGNFKRTYNGSALTEFNTVDSFPSNQYGYLETAGGTRMVVNITDIMKLNDYKGRTINRAELLIPYDNDDVYDNPGYVFGQYRKDNGKLVLLPDYASNGISAGGTAEESPYRYKINVTRFIQGLLNGEVHNPYIYLSAVDATGIGTYTDNAVTATRVVIHGPEFPTANNWEKMRLVVTFSE